eukprot:jgi/Mesvir1/23421/Mv21107-RA.1
MLAVSVRNSSFCGVGLLNFLGKAPTSALRVPPGRYALHVTATAEAKTKMGSAGAPPCPHLLSPLEHPSGLTLKNRVIMAPLTRARAGEDRVPKALNVEYYTQRVSAGLIISEGTTISPVANGWSCNAAIYTQEHVEGWKKVTSAVHAAGGLISCQLWHIGRASHSSYQPNNQLPVAPSAIALKEETAGKRHAADGSYQPNEVPRALETGEIPGVVEEFGMAARRAKEAGFDFVEIHGANGYLIDEFLQSSVNKRTDKYGGGKEGRFQILREVVERVCQELPSSRVAVRLSPNGAFNDMGSEDNFDAFLYYAAELNKYKLGFLHVMDGLQFGYHNKCPPVTLQDIRKVYDGPVMGNCGYTMEAAEEAVKNGHADVIAFGRLYLSNPDLVERFANNWPLAPVPPMDLWYASNLGAKGYTDFPRFAPAKQ